VQHGKSWRHRVDDEGHQLVYLSLEGESLCFGLGCHYILSSCKTDNVVRPQTRRAGRGGRGFLCDNEVRCVAPLHTHFERLTALGVAWDLLLLIARQADQREKVAI